MSSSIARLPFKEVTQLQPPVLRYLLICLGMVLGQRNATELGPFLWGYLCQLDTVTFSLEKAFFLCFVDLFIAEKQDRYYNI